MAPHDIAEEYVKSYIKLLDDPEVSNFQKVLEMKVGMSLDLGFLLT